MITFRDAAEYTYEYDPDTKMYRRMGYGDTPWNGFHARNVQTEESVLLDTWLGPEVVEWLPDN